MSELASLNRGATNVLVFSGIISADFYCDEILRGTLLPFIQSVYPDHHRFMQDNDPKHTSSKAQACMETLEINWWHTPPESPDLNPIENLWRELKHRLRTEVKPTNEESLVNGIISFWNNRVDAAKCQKYPGHLGKVVPAVIQREGRASGY